MSDLISREAASQMYLDKIERFQTFYAEQFEPDYLQIAITTIKECAHNLRDLPAVDAELVRHSHWEDAPEAKGYKRCAGCKDVYIYGEWLEQGKWGYCPNCGATMDAEE